MTMRVLARARLGQLGGRFSSGPGLERWLGVGVGSNSEWRRLREIRPGTPMRACASRQTPLIGESSSTGGGGVSGGEGIVGVGLAEPDVALAGAAAVLSFCARERRLDQEGALSSPAAIGARQLGSACSEEHARRVRVHRLFLERFELLAATQALRTHRVVRALLGRLRGRRSIAERARTTRWQMRRVFRCLGRQ